MSDPTPFHIRKMKVEDIDQVMIVEHDAFAVPWSEKAFHSELESNRFAHYFVAEYQGQIAGYCGSWVIIDEAHITNVAVLSRFRRKRIGEGLMRYVLDFVRKRGARSMSLEVRMSNEPAKRLYRKLGFINGGIRKSYYTNNYEDAQVMWVKL